MRKLLLLITLCFTLGAVAQRVTEQQALQKAQNFLKGKSFNKTNKARSVMGKSQNNPFNNFYIFNVENDEGFVIVSGDDRTKEILGYSDRGHLNYEEMPCNLKYWLSYYEEAIGAIPVGAKATRATTRSEKAAVSPLIETLWYQSSPFNNYCPPSPEDPNVNSVTGCVATAMAQVMNYHKYPDFLPALDAYTYHDSVTVSALEAKSMDWNNDDDLLWLSRYCGQSVYMKYGKNGSYTSDGYISAAMVKKFGYDGAERPVYRDVFDADTWEDMIYNELAAGRPVIYSGQDLETEPGAHIGHSFIVDGYDGTGFYHVNWGWGGGNDYYALDVMGPPDDYKFSSDQSAIIGIQPDKGGTANYPPFACTLMEVTSDLEVSRESTDDTFKNVTISWVLQSQLLEPGQYDCCIYISGDNIGGPLVSYTTMNVELGLYRFDIFTFDGVGWNICPKAADGKTDILPDGIYKLSMRYKVADEVIWHQPEGDDYRYVTMTKSGNTLKFVNHPSSVGPDPTGISAPSIKMPVTDAEVYYDLTGRRIQSPTKGLYIKNGKKIVIK